MDRRNFLKLAGASFASVAALNEALLQPRRALAANVPFKNLALAVITDQPETAIASVQSLCNQFAESRDALVFEECLLSGAQNGDIVLVHNNVLHDYRHAADELSQHLRALARELRLPRVMPHAVLLKFSTPDFSQKASTINVYHRQTLVQQYRMHEQVDGQEIKGSQGGVYVTLQHGHLRIAETSCKHKTCVGMGSIHRPGQSLICIPNELRLTVTGEGQRRIDGVSF